ncbi:MAG: ABC transporter permease subunit [Alphaproteobacteria bacterium]|nr:ABC transporter permease subunit [Alphaproteobacteria bacterium]
MNSRPLASATGLIVFLAIWEAIARSGLVASTLLPAPSVLPGALISEVSLGFWHAMVIASMEHYLIGLFLGSLLGIACGMAVALFPRVDATQAWLARVLRPIPPLAWIPFAIIWFGVSQSAAAFIISIGIFWINYFAALTAVESVDKELIELSNAFGHRSFFARLVKVILPGAAPGILGGFRAGLGMGWMTVVAAELFGIIGIGSRMMEAAGLLATEVVIVYMLTIAFLYAVSDTLFVRVRDRLLQWQQ